MRPPDPPGPPEAPETAAALLAAMAELGAEVNRLAAVASRAMPRKAVIRMLRLVIGAAVVTLLLTLAVENLGIRSCFLNPPSEPGLPRTACGLVFPGWEASRQDADRRLLVFNGLVERLKQVEADDAADAARVAELEARLERLETGG